MLEQWQKKPEIKKSVKNGVDEFLEKKVKQVLNLDDIKIEKKRSFIRLSFDFSSEDEINQWLKKLRK
jgi:phage terminase small subunit